MVVTLNLRKKLLKHPKWKRSEKAIRLIKEKLKKITKTENVKIDSSLNEAVWSKGNKNPPTKIKIRLKKEGEGFKAELAK